APEQHLPAIATTRSLRLVAVYSRSSRSVQALAQAAKKYASIAHDDLSVYCDEDGPEAGLDALLKRQDVDTVVMALPIPAQPALIEKAWRAGKSVISEKPVAPSVAEARRLISLSSSSDSSLPSLSTFRPRWLIAEQFPYTPSFDRAARLVRAGRIGRVRSFNVEVYIQVPKPEGEDNWRKVPDYQGGFLLDGGVHFAAALRHILPSPPISLSASVRQIQPYLPPIDTLQALVTCEDGTTGTFTVSFGIERPS
ncbi:NAD(P)-binding protein, partial [Rhodotorula sp. JG-1b]